MGRYVFLNTTISWNKGSAAQVASTVREIKSIDPSAEFATVSYCASQDESFAKHYGVRVIGYPDDTGRHLGRGLLAYSFRIAICLALGGILRCSRSNSGPIARFVRRERICRAILDADLVIDLSGDSLSDKGSHSFINIAGICACLLMRRPIVLHSQSIGPLAGVMIPFATCALTRSKFITVRELTSYEFLKSIGIPRDRIGVFGDCAFNLEAVPDKRARELLESAGAVHTQGAVRVGISVSALMAEFEAKRRRKVDPANTDYMKSVAAIARAFLDMSPTTEVILIPHVIAPTHWATDDRWACMEVAKFLDDSDRLHTLPNDYTAEELKGIIGSCDFFVGSRMHACIAALSQCIPTVALSWSHKYPGIMRRLGMESYVIDTGAQGTDETVLKVMKAFRDKEAIAAKLKEHVPSERSSAAEGTVAILKGTHAAAGP